MDIKEKCVYYNNKNGSYYLVLAVQDMIYGRCGNFSHPSYLDSYMNQETGLKFKINEQIVINMDYWRNYYLDDKELQNLEYVTKLSDEVFDCIDIICDMNYKISGLIDFTTIDCPNNLIHNIKQKEEELLKIEKEIKSHKLKLCKYLKSSDTLV